MGTLNRLKKYGSQASTAITSAPKAAKVFGEELASGIREEANRPGSAGQRFSDAPLGFTYPLPASVRSAAGFLAPSPRKVSRDVQKVSRNPSPGNIAAVGGDVLSIATLPALVSSAGRAPGVVAKASRSERVTSIAARGLPRGLKAGEAGYIRAAEMPGGVRLTLGPGKFAERAGKGRYTIDIVGSELGKDTVRVPWMQKTGQILPKQVGGEMEAVSRALKARGVAAVEHQPMSSSRSRLFARYLQSKGFKNVDQGAPDIRRAMPVNLKRGEEGALRFPDSPLNAMRRAKAKVMSKIAETGAQDVTEKLPAVQKEIGRLKKLGMGREVAPPWERRMLSRRAGERVGGRRASDAITTLKDIIVETHGKEALNWPLKMKRGALGAREVSVKWD